MKLYSVKEMKKLESILHSGLFDPVLCEMQPIGGLERKAHVEKKRCFYFFETKDAYFCLDNLDDGVLRAYPKTRALAKMS